MADETRAHGPSNLPFRLLTAGVFALAVALLVLAWRLPSTEAIAVAVSEQLEKDGFLKEDAFNARMDIVDAAHEAAAKAHEAILYAIPSLLAAADFHERIDRLEAALRNCCGRGGQLPKSIRVHYLQATFDNAKLQDGERHDTLEAALAALTPDNPGVALSPTQKDELDKYASAFRACAERGRVQLKVRGFSSTREFTDTTGQRHAFSDELNVKAANLRAEAVLRHLAERGATAENGVEVHHRPWEDYEAMRRPFLDAHEGFAGTAQEQLNRVVVVKIKDAGGCALPATGGAA